MYVTKTYWTRLVSGWSCFWIMRTTKWMERRKSWDWEERDTHCYNKIVIVWCLSLCLEGERGKRFMQCNVRYFVLWFCCKSFMIIYVIHFHLLLLDSLISAPILRFLWLLGRVLNCVIRKKILHVYNS